MKQFDQTSSRRETLKNLEIARAKRNEKKALDMAIYRPIENFDFQCLPLIYVTSSVSRESENSSSTINTVYANLRSEILYLEDCSKRVSDIATKHFFLKETLISMEFLSRLIKENESIGRKVFSAVTSTFRDSEDSNERIAGIRRMKFVSNSEEEKEEENERKEKIVECNDEDLIAKYNFIKNQYDELSTLLFDPLGSFINATPLLIFKLPLYSYSSWSLWQLTRYNNLIESYYERYISYSFFLNDENEREQEFMYYPHEKINTIVFLSTEEDREKIWLDPYRKLDFVQVKKTHEKNTRRDIFANSKESNGNRRDSYTLSGESTGEDFSSPFSKFERKSSKRQSVGRLSTVIEFKEHKARDDSSSSPKREKNIVDDTESLKTKKTKSKINKNTNTNNNWPPNADSKDKESKSTEKQGRNKHKKRLSGFFFASSAIPAGNNKKTISQKEREEDEEEKKSQNSWDDSSTTTTTAATTNINNYHFPIPSRKSLRDVLDQPKMSAMAENSQHPFPLSDQNQYDDVQLSTLSPLQEKSDTLLQKEKKKSTVRKIFTPKKKKKTNNDVPTF